MSKAKQPSRLGTVVAMHKSIGFGMIQVPKIKDKVFFSLASDYESIHFDDLNVGTKVRVIVQDTVRGPFAKLVKVA